MPFDVKTRLSKLKSSAKHRNINVNLDVNKYQELINAGCFYCGKDLQDEQGYCLDRVDNKKGYIITNTVGCCKYCNIAKSDRTLDEFFEWIATAQSHLKVKTAVVYIQSMLGMDYSEAGDMKRLDDLVKNKDKNRIKYINK